MQAERKPSALVGFGQLLASRLEELERKHPNPDHAARIEELVNELARRFEMHPEIDASTSAPAWRLVDTMTAHDIARLRVRTVTMLQPIEGGSR